MYMTPFITARMSCLRLPPPGFGGGTNGSTLEIHVRICQIDCKYCIVVAEVGPEQQGLRAIQKKLQAGEVTGIVVENSICPTSGCSDVAERIEHSEGVAVLQRCRGRIRELVAGL
jgi:hypothetical protein